MRRRVFEKLGGYPEVSIFEDLEMVRLLHKRGGFRFLPQAVTTAARRFESVGPLRQQALNLYLWTRYQLGTDPAAESFRSRVGEHVLGNGGGLLYPPDEEGGFIAPSNSPFSITTQER